MAKKIRTYLVVDGCIQEGSVVFTKGDLYNPPTAALEKELLDAGVIAVPVEQEGAARTLADAEAKALADAEAKALADAEVKALADAEAKPPGDLLGSGQ